jgi:hypothetical protein
MVRELMAAAVLVGGVPALGIAADVTVDLTAVVEDVFDPGNVLSGSIPVGTAITGRYRFDPGTPDTNPAPEVGDYWHTTAPYGLELQVGPFTFATDPSNVQFLVEIVNDFNSTDNYLLRSYANVSVGAALPNGATISHLSWQLDDPTQTALSTAQLPSIAPDLARWQSVFGLMIEGAACDPFAPPPPPGFPCFTTRFSARARVTSARATAAALNVRIDIRPLDDRNVIDPCRPDLVPVAVFSAPGFDARTIDPATVALQGAAAAVTQHGTPLSAVRDIDRDRLADVVLFFPQDAIQVTATDTSATLTGFTRDGTPVVGSDAVRVASRRCGGRGR